MSKIEKLHGASLDLAAFMVAHAPPEPLGRDAYASALIAAACHLYAERISGRKDSAVYDRLLDSCHAAIRGELPLGKVMTVDDRQSG